MSKPTTTIIARHEEPKLRVRGYLIGYLLSMAITLTAYLLVQNLSVSTTALEAAVVALALSQFLVQIYFFLHLGAETKPRWKLVVFLFMLGVVLIIVFGSIWIMSNLGPRMTLPQQLQYMNSQDGV
jgi:cytochrome o ubiquinol oxidase subunit IV